MNEIIRLDNVSIDSSGRNLLNTSLRINKGDFVLIYGDNAVGKSLLLKLLYLKILPSRVNIYLFKKKISSESKEKIIEYRKKLGVILQSDFLIPFLTLTVCWIIVSNLILWLLVMIGLGLFVYFVPYKNIKIIQNQLAKIIELLEKK